MSDNNKNILPKGYTLRSPNYVYRIESVLGSGGFGITYLATATVKIGNVSVKARFALKEHFLDSDCERSDDSRVVYSNPAKMRVENSRKDFMAEARRLHQIGAGHSNIVKVNEVFEANNTAYYVMEYLDGESLRAYVKRKGKLTEEETVEIMTPIVDAVNYLHGGRMTHLDIKPDNIMLVSDDDGRMRPVLIDFGLSKHYDSNGRPTSTINTLGCSDGYAPIEQYAGITTFSPTADYYALGATIWFCLTGKDPRKSTDLREGELAEALPETCRQLRPVVAAATHINRDDRRLLLLSDNPDVPVIKEPIRKNEVKEKTRLIDDAGEKRNWAPIAAAVAVVVVVLALGFKFLVGSDRHAEEAVAVDSLVAEDMVIDTPVTVGTYTPSNELPAIETPSQPEKEPVVPSKTPGNLKLCVERDGQIGYFTKAQWKELTGVEKKHYRKKGLCVISDGQRFLLALNDSGKEMTWDEVMSRYGNSLPTKEQGEVMAKNYKAINAAIIAFGGDNNPAWDYWTRTENYSSYAWCVGMTDGDILSAYEAQAWRVRTVAPVPSSAM